MASSSRDLVVRILADTKDLVAGVNKAEGSLGKLKSAAVVAGGALVAGFAATKVVDFLGDATKAAEEDAKSQALLATQLKTSTKATDEQIASTEKFISKLSRQTGVMDDDLRPAFSALARATGNTEDAQAELAIAMDIAAARGVDLNTVTTALEKAHNGNTGALGRLGIATKDAAGNTLTLEQAMAGAAKTYAGAAEAAVTPSERWNVAFQELKEQVGTALLPALSALAGFMADTLLPALQAAVQWVQDNWPAISKTIKEDVDKIVGYVKPVLETIAELWARFGDDIVRSVKGAFDLIAGSIRTGVALVQAIIQPIVDILHGDWSKAWDDFARRIGEAWDGIKQQVQGAVEFVTGILGGLVSAVGELPGKITKAAIGMWDGLVHGFKAAVNTIIRGWNSIEFKIPGFHIGKVGYDGFTLGLPDIPQLARGGIVRSPTLAMIGESGPEAVVPLNGRSGMGATVVLNNPVFNGVTDIRKFYAELAQVARREGGIRLPLGVTAV